MLKDYWERRDNCTSEKYDCYVRINHPTILLEGLHDHSVSILHMEQLTTNLVYSTFSRNSSVVHIYVISKHHAMAQNIS